MIKLRRSARDVRSRSGKPLLLFFYSRASGRCERVEGFIADVLGHRQNHSTFALHQIERDLRPDLFERFEIKDTPALLVVDRKRTRVRLDQPRGYAEVQTALAPWLR